MCHVGATLQVQFLQRAQYDVKKSCLLLPFISNRPVCGSSAEIVWKSLGCEILGAKLIETHKSDDIRMSAELGADNFPGDSEESLRLHKKHLAKPLGIVLINRLDKKRTELKVHVCR